MGIIALIKSEKAHIHQRIFGKYATVKSELRSLLSFLKVKFKKEQKEIMTKFRTNNEQIRNKENTLGITIRVSQIPENTNIRLKIIKPRINNKFIHLIR